MPVTNQNNTILPAQAAVANDAQGLFAGNESGFDHLLDLLNLEDANSGCMVILTSASREAKDRAMELIVADLCERNPRDAVSITAVGNLNIRLPRNAWTKQADRLMESDLTALDKGFGQVVLIDEVRTYQDAKVATMLAKRGHKVIFTHAAKSCEAVIADLSNMLCTLCHTETVMMDTVLATLCAHDRVRAVHVS